jgi:hypothetical protein
MVERDAFGTAEAEQGADLIDADLVDFGFRQFHAPPAKAHQVGIGDVGAELDSVVLGQRDRAGHRAGIGGVIAAGDVDRGDERHQGLVAAERIAAE